MSENMTTITSHQRRRLAAGITARIRRYEHCLKLIPAVDSEVFKAGMELFGAEASLGLWLCQPARSLGGKIPLQVMRTAKGRATVAGVLRAIAEGIFL